MTDPIKMLLDDHDRFKELFTEFSETEVFEMRREVFNRLARELKVHTKIEEEIFYPAVKKTTDQDDLVRESLQEHHVANLLITELQDMTADDQSGQDEFDAKFQVLKENVEHHLEEEELKMFPQVQDCGLYDEDDVAARMEKRREELEEELHLI